MGFQQHLTFLQRHALERHFFVECSIVDTTQVVASGCEVNIVNVIGNRECSKKYPVIISWRWDMGYVGTKASLIKNYAVCAMWSQPSFSDGKNVYLKQIITH